MHHTPAQRARKFTNYASTFLERHPSNNQIRKNLKSITPNDHANYLDPPAKFNPSIARVLCWYKSEDQEKRKINKHLVVWVS
jgi:hypothetical protein